LHYDLFHARALGLRGATYETKFGDRRTYCVGGKMFAMAGHVGEETPIYGFKTSPMAFELLVESGLGRPMPYLQRAKWVELLHHESLDAQELMAYVAQAHALIAAKLTRAGRAELGL
jgi:predicted DNA-binding protein (MmcQ/YjbR family)